MFHRRRFRRIRWVVGATAALTLLGVGLITASPAEAGVTSVENGFEGNPYYFWKVDYDEGDSIVTLINHVDAHNGAGGYLAWFDAPSSVPARIYAGPLTVPRPSGTQVMCTANAFIAKATGWAGSVRFTLKIRTHAEQDGINIDSSSYTLPATSTGWGRAEFAHWPYQDTNLFIDISVTGGMGYVDDVSIQCSSAIT